MKAISTNPAQVYIDGLGSVASRQTASLALNRIARIYSDGEHDRHTLNWGGLRYKDTAAIRSHLIQHTKPKTVNKNLAMLRGVLKAAWRLGQMSADDYQHAVDIKNVYSTNTVPGKMLTDEEVKALFRTCDGPELCNVRDRALISVLLNTGMRRSELIAVDVQDYNPKDRTILIRHGKSHQIRQAFLPDSAVESLNAWLAAMTQQITITDDTPLFVAVRKDGKIGSERVSSQAIYKIILRRGEAAGIDEISPHDFRRTLISTLLDRGADVTMVASLVGHSHVDRTAAYDRRTDVHKRKAASLVDFSGDERQDT